MYRLDESICTHLYVCILILSKYYAYVHFLIKFSETICIYLAFYERILEFMSLMAFLFDLLSRLQNMSILFFCTAFFLFSRKQGCHVVFVLSLDFFFSFSTCFSLTWRPQLCAAALSSTVALFNITLFSVLNILLFLFQWVFLC